MNIIVDILSGKHLRESMTVFLLLLLPIFSSCEDPQKKDNFPNAFFDLKGFIEGQVLQLNKEQPVVSKRMGIGKESSQVSTKEIDWKKELELFTQADINKPAFRQSYITERPDSLTYIYTLKQGQDLPVKILKIKLHTDHGLPEKINARLRSENKLYRSEKNITLALKVEGNTASITTYNIIGYQKLVFMEKKPFLVAAAVKY